MRIGAAVPLFRSIPKTAESDRVQPFRSSPREPPFKPSGQLPFQFPDRPQKRQNPIGFCRSVALPKTPPAVPWPRPKRRLPFRGLAQNAACRSAAQSRSPPGASCRSVGLAISPAAVPCRQLPFRGPGHIASCRSVALSLAIISPAVVPWPCGPTGLYGGPMGPCNDPVGAL